MSLETLNEIDTKIKGELMAVNPAYFTGRDGSHLTANDYWIRYYASGSKLQKPTGISFNPDRTPYAQILVSKKREQKIDVAVSGFRILDNVIDCLQLQGGKSKSKYWALSQFAWRSALLDNLIRLGKDVGFREIRLIPAKLIDDIDKSNGERLIETYDKMAEKYGFRYSEINRRFILDLN